MVMGQKSGDRAINPIRRKQIANAPVGILLEAGVVRNHDHCHALRDVQVGQQLHHDLQKECVHSEGDMKDENKS